MDFYKANFAAFALLNAVLAYREYRQVESRQDPDDDESKLLGEGTRAALKKFKWNFIPIYLLANGADWLQVRFLRGSTDGS
jgi:MFS transporter, MFS domain-containing protein family, molybdate-anion transporter